MGLHYFFHRITMATTRREALRLFKALHRTAQTVFRGDLPTMIAARDRIEEEFRSNAACADPEGLIRDGWEANRELRENVHQLRPTGRGTYELAVREEALKDNDPFREVSREEYRDYVRRARAQGIRSCVEEAEKLKKSGRK